MTPVRDETKSLPRAFPSNPNILEVQRRKGRAPSGTPNGSKCVAIWKSKADTDAIRFLRRAGL